MKSAIVLFSILVVCHCIELPKYFTKCSKSDPDLSGCLLKNAKEAWPTFLKGDKSYHIQPLNPLRIPFMHIDIDGNLKANLTDATVAGMKDAEFQEIKFDLTKKRIDLKFLLPRLSFVGDYEINGRLLLLPITGKGPANITFVNMLNTHFLEYVISERAGKQYMDVKRTAMTYTVTRAYFRLDNLFNGDERLGAAMNTVLDESWEAVNEEVGARVGDAIGEVFTQVLQSFFKKVSLNELFSD